MRSTDGGGVVVVVVSTKKNRSWLSTTSSLWNFVTAVALIDENTHHNIF